jgi:hypothetical protein
VNKGLYDKYESFVSFPNKSLAQNDTILILIIFYTPLCFLFVDFGSVFGEKW